MKIVLKEDYNKIPKDSTIDVERETKTLYIGTWSSICGTYSVRIPKRISKKYRNPKYFSYLKNLL